MAINLRAPVVPGFNFQQPRAPQAPLFDGYANLQRSMNAPYYEDTVQKATGSNPYGSIAGGPTLSQALDIVKRDPKQWTSVGPPKMVSGTILGDLSAKPASSTSKLGSFNLNLIDPYQSYQQATGVNIGQPPPGGLGTPGAETDPVRKLLTMGLNWQSDLPIKLMERPLAVVQTLANRISGTKSPVQADDGAAVYPFQNDPGYWDWLRGASEEQIVQQARAVAGQYISPGRNQALVDTLVSRYREDKVIVGGLSSGNSQIDYSAKLAFTKDVIQGTYKQGTWEYGVAKSVAASGDIVSSFIPLIGTDIAKSLYGIDPMIEARWAGLSEAERTKYLGDAGFRTTVLSLASALPLFGGLGYVAAAAKASSLPAIATMGMVWAKTLKAANIMMAIGVATTTADWVVEAAAPRTWAGDFARDANLADPLGHTALGGALNQIGFFASGTFGASLALKVGGRIAGGAVRLAGAGEGISQAVDARLSGGRITGAWSKAAGAIGTHELPYVTDVYGGGQVIDLFQRHAGVEATTSEFAVKESMLSYLTKGQVAAAERLVQRAKAGEAISPEIDALPVAERQAWAENELTSMLDTQHQRVGTWVQRLAKIRQGLPLMPSDQQAIAMKATRDGVRSEMDSATREHLNAYGPTFFGSNLKEIRGSVEARLKENGYTPDMAAFDRELGTKENVATVQKWRQAARLAHELGFIQKNAALQEKLVGSGEAAATIFSQKTLFANDIREAVPVLTGADAVAARTMVATMLRKTRVAELYALGEFRDGKRTILPSEVDPAALAYHLQSILEQAGAPERRVNQMDPGDPTYDLPLNAWHRQLTSEGAWEIGFRAKRLIPVEMPFATRLEELLTPIELQASEPKSVLVRDVQPGEVPAGYVEITAGTQIKRKNWYALEPIYSSDGRYFVKDDPSLAAAAAAAPLVANRRTLQGDPQPIDQYTPGWSDLTPEERTLARDPLVDVQASFEPKPYANELQSTGMSVSGRNAGAEWPILQHTSTGDRYVFKARRNPGGPLTSLSPARLLGGVTASKLFKYLGLNTAEEMPFTWKGVDGTIQKLVDVHEKVNLDRLESNNPETINEVVKHHIADWLTAQHDSNSDSLLAGEDGLIYGIDKGQAYKYVADPAASELKAMSSEFWTYAYDAADTHLGEYIQNAVERGMPLDRSAVEPLVAKIEALPEDVYLAAMRPLAEARVADGRFETTVGEFYTNALTRKRFMRQAVNKAFEDLGFAGLQKAEVPIQSWRSGLKGLLDVNGTPTRVNERPIPLEELYAYNTAHPVDEPALPPTTDHYKAGVVVREPDGQLWVINPIDRTSGGQYPATWPKGHVDRVGGVDETPQQTAIREASEEAGLSVRLKSHLIDLPNEQGNITRYYLAERVSGGPEHVITLNETHSVMLAKGDYTRSLFDPGSRDAAVMDALTAYDAGAQAKVQLDGADSAAPDNPVTADPAKEWGYVSHVRLKNGEVWRSPWVDVGMAEGAQIDLGNRGMVGRGLDSVFQGWKSRRLMESQKATLHYKLTRDHPGFTPDQIELFYEKLGALQRDSNMSVQAMAGVNPHIPGIGNWAKKVADAGVEVFGEGPFLGRDGEFHPVDWNRVTVNAFRQSVRLNLTAGLTSYLKSMPGIGQAVIPLTDLAYPILRFGISFLFKGGEFVESAQLNAQRGTIYSGDPFTDSLYWKAGAGNGLGVLLDDMGADMQLQGLTMLTGAGSPQAKTSSSPFFFERTDPAKYAHQVADILAPKEAPPGVPLSPLNEALGGAKLEAPNPVLFPDVYPTSVPRQLLPTEIDPSTGDVMVDFAGGSTTEHQVAVYRDEALASIASDLLSNPARAEDYGRAFALLNSLPAGTVEKLAEHIPLAHTPVTRNFTAPLERQIGFVEQAIKDGNPMYSGVLSTGQYALEAKARAAGGVAITGGRAGGYGLSSSTISGEEQAVGFADAKYGSMAAKYAEGDAPMFAILKPSKLQDSVTVNADRIGYAADVQGLRDAMMTPAAVNGITRVVLQKMILTWAADFPSMTFLDFLAAHGHESFRGVSPFEMAYMNGINFGDVAEVMVPKSGIGQWNDLTTTYKDHPNAKGLAEIKVTPYEDSGGRGYGATLGFERPMWASALERAGLTDFGLSYPVTPNLNSDAAIAALPSWTITPASLSNLEHRVEGVAGSRLNMSAGLVHSDLDELAIAINKQRIRLKEATGELAKSQTVEKSNYASSDASIYEKRIAEGEAHLASLEALNKEVSDFYASSSLDLASAQAQAAPPGTLTGPGALEDQWLATRHELTARMSALNVKKGSGARKGEVRITRNGDVVATRTYDPQHLEAIVPINHPGGVTTLPEGDIPYRVIKTQALLDEYQRRVPAGYTANPGDLLPPDVVKTVTEAVDSPAFRAIVRARAEQKLGHPVVSDPVIRAYIRGDGHYLTGDGGSGKGSDLVVTINDGAGQPYGNLTLAELSDLWANNGLPKALADRAAAAGYAVNDAGHLTNQWGDGQGHLFHGPGATPEGKLYYYREVTGPSGAFEQGPLGQSYSDPSAHVALDTRMAYSFDPAGKSYLALHDNTAYLKPYVDTHQRGTMTEVEYRIPGSSYATWGYSLSKTTGGNLSVGAIHLDSGAEALAVLRDIFERTKPAPGAKPTATKIEGLSPGKDIRIAFERMYARGEVPDWIVGADNGKPIDNLQISQDLTGSSAVVDQLPPPPAADFTEIKGSPEAFTQTLFEKVAAKALKTRPLKEFDLMNPTPFKQRQMDKLTFKLVRESFAPLLKTEVPKAAAIFSELKVPEAKWADFLVHDRYLMSRFKESGSTGDFEAMVLHASRYTGKADYLATQKSLDELYMSPDFPAMLDTWRLAVKAAEDESYAVHFFSPYRSTFERSINHPLLGIYPASWAFKVAKEWYRFLYQNQTLGFKAGMVPAQMMKSIYTAQQQAWARSNPETLDQYYNKGPLSSSIFIFNLLLPGDWSSVPEPFSRTIRDVVRGNTNLFDLFSRNMTYMGIGRDIRLLSESAGELSHAFDPSQKGGAYSKATSATTGGKPATFLNSQSVRDFYAYR